MLSSSSIEYLPFLFSDKELPPQCFKEGNLHAYVTTAEVKGMTKECVRRCYQPFSGADLVLIEVESINLYHSKKVEQIITGPINYARYLPAYYLEMRDLPETHPEVHQAFMAGEFAVQRQNQYGFAQITCDQTIGSTLNRDTKTKGGLTGFTLKKGAVQRWIIAQPERVALTNQLKEMAGKGDEARDYKDISRTRAMQDESPCAQRHFNDYLHDQPLCNR